MSDTKRVERKEDMSPRGRLCVCIQPDGDAIVHVIPDPDAPDNGSLPTAEFCTSGGRSPNTRVAIYRLFEAMEKDNLGRPLENFEEAGVARTAVDMLIGALRAVRPSCRAPDCWCEASYDVGRFGHSPRCIAAQKAIAFARIEPQ